MALEQRGARAGRRSRSTSARPSRSARSCSSKLKLPVMKKTPTGAPSTDEDVLAGARRRLSAAEADPRAPRAVEAEVDLHRQAAADGQPAHRPRAHDVRAGRRGDRAARRRTTRTCRTSRSAPPRAGASARRSSRRRARDRLGRLLADRAAHHGAPVGRRRPAARVRAKARTSTARPPPRSSACRSAEVDARAAALRQGDQLRPDLRHERVRPGAASSASSAAPRSTTSSATSRAIPGVAALHGRDARSRRASSGYVETVFGRRLWLPEINARATVRAAQAAERAAINAPMQGTAADLIKLAMIAVQELARPRAARRRS